MKIFIFALLFVTIFFLYHYLRLQSKIAFSKNLVKNTTSFNMITDDYTKTVLVLGDSTAFGVGATSPDESIPGLFSKATYATYLENQGVSGAVVHDLQEQVKEAKLEYYDYILIQIGGNDVVARHNVILVSEELSQIINTLPKHKKLMVQMCGNLGTAPLLPWFVRGYYTRKNLEYHSAFESVVNRSGGIYVNLHIDPSIDPFKLEPEIYFSSDSFHPSSAGYKVWFQKLEKAI